MGGLWQWNGGDEWEWNGNSGQGITWNFYNIPKLGGVASTQDQP